LEFVGRVDNQVKVRGYRIELGEIEAVLTSHPNIRQAVVMAREDALGEKLLVAYAVLNQGLDFRVNDLRSMAKEKLPEYMMPASFVLLKEMPLTPGGKVDYRALPSPEQVRSALDAGFAAPRTPVEELLADIWMEVLGLTQVGIDDNFFELGGHSLRATQLISRVRQVFEVELPVRELFAWPTVAGLAARLEARMQSSSSLPQAPPIRPIVERERVPLSFAQQRLWFLDQLEPGTPLYNVAAAVRLTGTLNVSALEHSFNEVVCRHEALRTSFPTRDGQPIQLVSPPMPFPLPLTDLSALSVSEREEHKQRLLSTEATRPFDLAAGGLLRLSLLRLSATEHLLLLTMHHIVSDGWSLGLLVKEVAALYAAYSAGQRSPLAALPIQYADFAQWQRHWLSGPVLAAQLDYWRRQLAGLSPLQLPVDGERREVGSSQGATKQFEVGESLSLGLKELSRRAGVTLFMTLVGAFQTLLWRSTGQEDVVVGTDVANRNRAETEGLIGFFVNQLVLRSDMSGNPSFGELLKRVREVTLGAYAHQDVPFEKVVEALNPDRAMSRMPLFQVKIVLQNAPMPALELSGLKLMPVEVENRTAKYDLLFTLTETEQGISASLEYNTNLFEATTIARLLEQFQLLLEGIVAQPDVKLRDLRAILDEDDRRRSLMQEKEFGEVRRRKLRNITPKPVGGATLEGQLTL
jgi:non-ribosomal peptide synthetase component F